MRLNATSLGMFFSEKLPHFNIKKYAAGLLILGICIIISILIALQLINVNKVSCGDLAPQAQNIFRPNPKLLKKAEERYRKIKVTAKNCSTTEFLFIHRSDNRNILVFYRNMAIASNSFGDYSDAKSYAAKALSYNNKVKDNQRGSTIPQRQYMKVEMEAIRNGSY